MRIRKLPTAIFLISIALLTSAAWLLRQRSSFASIEAEINRIYGSCRPFPYRWSGAPYRPLKNPPCQPDQRALEILTGKIDAAERNAGRSARSLQLSGRLNLLHGDYDDAVTKYRLAMLLDPGNSALQLELGIGFALRAKAEDRALDFESALEQVLGSQQLQGSPEVLFDSALLFEMAQMPLQAVDRWSQAAASETVSAWGIEDQERRVELMKTLQTREQRMRALTDSPASYLAHADDAKGSIELVMSEALENWITRGSSLHRQALERLATELREKHHDPWLTDLLRIPDSPVGKRALQELSDAWVANLRGEHLRAGTSAASAEELFHKLENPAGELRAHVERVYAFDRVWREKKCIHALPNLRAPAHARHYVWIEGQASLERASCLAQTRKESVIASRERTNAWVCATGYAGLCLRGQNFLTEAYGGLDSQVRIWNQGFRSLHTFWQEALPPIRGYFCFYSLAASAHKAGQPRAALALLREGIRLLEQSPNRQLLALVLSDLGNWEVQSDRPGEGALAFNRMESIFGALRVNETETFRRESEITRAEAELTSGNPEAALARLKRVIGDLKFPYSTFGPPERRRLLPVYGNVYLALGELNVAAKYFRQILSENRRALRKIHDRAQRNSAQRETESAWKGLTEVELSRHRVTQALETWEAFRGGWLADPYPKSIRVPEGVTLLVYAFLHRGLSAWMVSSHGCEHRWLDERQVAGAAHQFSALAADPASPAAAVSASSRRLHRLLLEPFGPSLPETGLLVVDADRDLAAVPWSALENPKGTILLERFAIAQIQSWAEVSRFTDSSSADFHRPLIIAEPALGPELARIYPPLPEARIEAQRLHRILPHAAYYEGPTATSAALIRALPLASMLYFAGHGISHGGYGALLLAPSTDAQARPQLLTADEIENLKLPNLSVAVLASCSSGEGESAGFVNLDSLVRGFLKAGARSVVATRWSVNSSKTTDLMTTFYRYLLQGLRPAEALRQATLENRRNSATAHPSYWAGFQVFGMP
jgi:CHAT domain-containing protein/tetratricopeptide (TPR) repeat protein